MIAGSCHCGAVTFELHADPEHLVDCNCSICRRYGALWSHADLDKIIINAASGQLRHYSWGDGEIAFNACKTCNCLTHWSPVDKTGSLDYMAVNLRMADTKAIKHLPIRRFDGADSWTFLD